VAHDPNLIATSHAPQQWWRLLLHAVLLLPDDQVKKDDFFYVYTTTLHTMSDCCRTLSNTELDLLTEMRQLTATINLDIMTGPVCRTTRNFDELNALRTRLLVCSTNAAVRQLVISRVDELDAALKVAILNGHPQPPWIHKCKICLSASVCILLVAGCVVWVVLQFR
jgi:hypothetical protein